MPSLLPLTNKGLTRAETADFFRGLAELVETYPTEGFVVTVDIVAAATAASSTTAKKRARTKHSA